MLYTDHKPLLAIFGDRKGIPIFAANRLQRWAHILSAFNYEIRYVNSDKNTADFLSRVPKNYEEQDNTNEKKFYFVHCKINISYINFLSDSGLPLDFKKIKSKTAKDSLLSKVFYYVKNGWPFKCTLDEFKPFFLRKNEFSIEQGCLMWGYRIIIPKKF